MRRNLAAMILGGLLGLCACGPGETPEQRHHEANTPAGKLGQAAHKVTVETGKASRVVGRQLDKAAHDAHEGWKEAGQKDARQK